MPNLLVLLLDDGSQDELRRLAAELDPDTRVHVVVPTRVGALQWLATDEGAARARAEVRALESEWTLAAAAEVEGEAGEADPVQAVDDALRAFAADEIVVVGGPWRDEELDRRLLATGLRVTRRGAEPTRAGPRRRLTRALTSGRSTATPFVFFAGVNVALLVLSAVLSLLVIAVLWLFF